MVVKRLGEFERRRMYWDSLYVEIKGSYIEWKWKCKSRKNKQRKKQENLFFPSIFEEIKEIFD